MSTRAIAPIVGVTKSSVDRDVQVSQGGTPETADDGPPDLLPEAEEDPEGEPVDIGP